MQWIVLVLLSGPMASLTYANPSTVSGLQGQTFPSLNPYITTTDPVIFRTPRLDTLLAPTPVPIPASSPAPTPAQAPNLRSYVSGSYLLVAPKTALPGFTFTLMFESFVDKTLRLDAQILLRTYNYVIKDFQYYPIVSDHVQIVKGQPGFIHLPVPANVVDGSYQWVVGCDECTFFPYHNPQPSLGPWTHFIESELSVKLDTLNIFVQTDKAIYKPGQLVHYRVFAVYPDLRMYTGMFQIEIRDPNGNKIQRLTDANGPQGVVEGSLQLADKPLNGDWTIFAEIQTSRSTHLSKSFTVYDYTLPRFEVKVELPSYLLTTDAAMQGKVKSKYTFGQPVKGLVELHVSSTSAFGSCGREPPFVQLVFDIDGEASFSVPRADISRVVGIRSGAKVKVTAFVKEALTDVRLRGTAEITFYDTPYKVSITDNTPSVFKPGLPFSIFAKCSMQDDSPVSGYSTITVFTTATYSMHVNNSYLFGTSSFYGTYPLPVQTVTVPPSGVVKIDLDIPVNASSLSVTVDFKGLSATKTIDKMYSASKNYLQLILLDKNLRSGQAALVEAKATEPMDKLFYQVLSRGTVYEAKTVDTRGQNAIVLSIRLTPQASPTIHMMAYYVRHDLEIVADSIAFNVDGVFENEVTLGFSNNRTEPHQDINVYATADPGSIVHILAVDQSVLLLKTGNDVTPDQAVGVVSRYDVGKTPKDSDFALSLSQKNIISTLMDVGVEVFSDADLRATEDRYVETDDPSIYGPKVLALTIPVGYPNGPNMTPAPGMMYPPGFTGQQPNMPSGEGLAEVQRVRSLFPETFLWLSRSVNDSGSVTIPTTVPDTITSWVITAFATNLQTGLGMTPSASKLTVFRSFFVGLNLPASVVRGEHVVVEASVFNYLLLDLAVLVSLPGSHDYTSIIIGPDKSESLSNEDQQRTVFVKSNEQAVVYFSIIPSSVGIIDIEVSVRSTLAADGERRQLVVQAEGVPNELSIPVLISLDPSNLGTYSQTFPVSLPDDVVQGSSRSRIKVTGDILGPSMDGLENLLRMPTGCGEQNMIGMAPDLYIARYLRQTGKMTATLEKRIKNLLEIGYQTELTYQWKDGGFSAFGERDNAGSTWLTAFVLRVFHEARSEIYVDRAVLQKTMDWLLEHQNADGSFNEFGHLVDPQMKLDGHSPGLTAFVLLALMENSDIPETKEQRAIYENSTQNALDFLELNHWTISDALSRAVTTLALLKAHSVVADAALAELRAGLITEDGMTFWKSDQTNQTDAGRYWQPSVVRARPIEIQVTSYTLLAYAAKGLTREGMGILHWLTRQRNPNGGFVSTQDTIVALQAMSEFLASTAPSGDDLHIEVRAEQSTSHFNVSLSNALVLQSSELSFIPSEVSFQATGLGVAVAEFDFFFNSESEFGKPAFGVSTVLLDDYLNSFKLMICTRWLLNASSGMVVQEVGIPSGFAPDMSSVGNVAGLKYVEQRGRFLDVYFDTITRNSLCYTMMFDRQEKVAQCQPAFVITRDYYEPENKATVRYQPVSLRDSTVCDVCKDCCP